MDFIYEENRIYAKDENEIMIAEVTFPYLSEDVVNLNHTFVDDSLQGRGIAGELMKAAAKTFRLKYKKAYLTCSYAVKWFEAHPDYADVCVEKSFKP